MTNIQSDLQALADSLDDFVREYGEEAVRAFLRKYVNGLRTNTK